MPRDAPFAKHARQQRFLSGAREASGAPSSCCRPRRGRQHGTKRRSYLEENAAAAATELSAEELDRLEQSSRPERPRANRYPDLSTVNR